MDTGVAVELFLWTIVVILGGFIIQRVRKIGPFKPTVMDVPAQAQKPVELRDFTPAELKEFTGANEAKPILFSVKGKVYDVSSGRGFYGPGGGYHVFAGNECARALAIMSTKSEDVGSSSTEGLGADEIDTLNQWIAKFDSKYTHVGTLHAAKN